jgi:hypothetical protein
LSNNNKINEIIAQDIQLMHDIKQTESGINKSSRGTQGGINESQRGLSGSTNGPRKLGLNVSP